MYDRAARTFTFQLLTGTSANVGPGSYDAIVSKCHEYYVGYAPFNTLAECKRELTSADVATCPAPWDYKPEQSQCAIKGGSSVRNRDVRFHPLKPFGPGPDAYNITSKWGAKYPGPCGLAIPDSMLQTPEEIEAMEKAQALCNRINVVRFRDVPSIPSGSNANGYQEGRDGRLQPQTGIYKENIRRKSFSDLTPASSCLRYHGCSWSKSTSQRPPLFKPTHDVGPAQYEPYPDPWEKIIQQARERDAVNLQNPLEVPRLIDKVMREVKRLDFPAPNAYELPDAIKTNTAQRTFRGVPLHGAPFNVEAERFKCPPGDTPGPDTYGIHKKWGASPSKAPFNSTAVRFTTKFEGSPAPNSYEPSNSFIDEMNRRNDQKSLLKPSVPFGSTARRTTTVLPEQLGGSKSPPKEIEGAPNAAQNQDTFYQEPKRDWAKVPNLGVGSRVYNLVQSDVPGPGTYEVAESFDVTQSKCCRKSPLTLEGKERQGMFLSTADRFDKQSFFAPKDPSMPGPADFCLPSSLNENTGKFVYRAERFKDKSTTPMPGPADYGIAPAVESCLRLDTFNVTLPGKVAAAPQALRRS
ncbi:hypothetical protein CRM22_005446 [Opisthorchis felineus]|uniref:Sperm-tail PG-rich repeat-containing protein 2 n=1 Tax=Opisthorchis felineus TaxID=147828 RepID=A0A4S2LR14_OPIFE|nr:hypothetical protein CRM22_005446 [Opisthorchis felineus]